MAIKERPLLIRILALGTKGIGALHYCSTWNFFRWLSSWGLKKKKSNR